MWQSASAKLLKPLFTFSRYGSMGSLLLLALLARCAAAAEEGLAVALHAQAYPVEGGLIVGSVMTTNGLKRALLRSGRVRVARSFYPFHYSGIADEAWDLVIIEGWFEMSNAFIHEVRRLRPAVVVLYWCLDPHFPGLDAIGSLDVDGYLTNSATVAATLGNVAPAEVVNLAVDLDEMAPAAARAPAGAPLVFETSMLVELAGDGHEAQVPADALHGRRHGDGRPPRVRAAAGLGLRRRCIAAGVGLRLGCGRRLAGCGRRLLIRQGAQGLDLGARRRPRLVRALQRREPLHLDAAQPEPRAKRREKAAQRQRAALQLRCLY